MEETKREEDVANEEFVVAVAATDERVLAERNVSMFFL